MRRLLGRREMQGEQMLGIGAAPEVEVDGQVFRNMTEAMAVPVDIHSIIWPALMACMVTQVNLVMLDIQARQAGGVQVGTVGLTILPVAVLVPMEVRAVEVATVGQPGDVEVAV